MVALTANSDPFALEHRFDVPPIPCIVSAETFDFDGFGWCASTTLAVRMSSSLSHAEPVTGENPGEMLFLLRGEALFLPKELAYLHLADLSPEARGEWSLAPYAIDDATDELFARKLSPAPWMTLVTRSVRGLFWGLHDWSHFHNHGPFTNIPETELQCDVAALHWMRLNMNAWGGSRGELQGIASHVFAHALKRFTASNAYARIAHAKQVYETLSSNTGT
jgi:hypothetical protein